MYYLIIVSANNTIKVLTYSLGQCLSLSSHSLEFELNYKTYSLFQIELSIMFYKLSPEIENIVLFLILMVLILKVVDLILNRRKQLYHVPGPVPLPLVGNALLFASAHENFLPTMKNVSSSEIIQIMLLTKLFQLTDQYGKSFRLHLGCRANLVVSSPEAYERILSSTTQLNKVF